MPETLLEVQNLSVVYKTDLETVYALNGVSLKLEKGKTLGLVGETGAGKTSLALAILRVLPKPTGIITGGKIIYQGQDLAELNDAKMRAIRGNMISMIFQDPMTSLNPILKIGDQIAESLLLHNSEKLSKEQIDQRVKETLELVSIPAFRKDEYPHQFSGGMKQRVGIAMALVCKPNFIIADEPTTALDVTIQAQVLALMAELKELLETSMIMISHDLGVVAQICDDVAVMYAGEIIEYGTVKDVFTKGFHHPYTMGLFGSLPNLTEKSARLMALDGLMPDPTNLPGGCSFHPRCSKAMPICKEQKPPDIELSNGLKIHCFLAENGGSS